MHGMRINPERLVVTGSSGFVGRALMQRLGSGVAVLTLRSEPNQWASVLAKKDCVIHLSARVHVMRELAGDPLSEFRKVNVENTLNLARIAAAADVKRFVFISSIKVNGEQTRLGQSFFADDTPSPQDPYSISKWEAEQGLIKLSQETGMEVVIIRPPLVYGPGVKANFASMMRWISSGIPLPLGCVTQNRRSFVALENLVDLIKVCTSHPAAANEIFLVSDGEDVSTSELLRRMGHALGRPAVLINCPLRYLEWTSRMIHKKGIYDRLCGSLQMDIGKTLELLDWTPPITVDEGLLLAAEDFRQ